MQTILVLAAVAAISGEATQSPRAVVSKDSVVFFMPVREDGTLWEVDTLPGGREEQRWVVDVPLRSRDGKDWIIHFGVIRQSRGGGLRLGQIEDVLDESETYFWRSDASTGEMIDHKKYPFPFRIEFANGVLKLLINRLEFVEPIAMLQAATFLMHGVTPNGETYTEPMQVENQPDTMEAEARSIEGPFSPDEYAIYQTVIARYQNEYRSERPWYLMTPTSTFRTFDTTKPYVPPNFGLADPSTAEMFEANRLIESDLSSLNNLGVAVVDRDSFVTAMREMHERGEMPGPAYTVSLSRIGFNPDQTQAMLYCGFSSGPLGSEGEIVLLEKKGRSWFVVAHVTIWQS